MVHLFLIKMDLFKRTIYGKDHYAHNISKPGILAHKLGVGIIELSEGAWHRRRDIRNAVPGANVSFSGIYDYPVVRLGMVVKYKKPLIRLPELSSMADKILDLCPMPIDKRRACVYTVDRCHLVVVTSSWIIDNIICKTWQFAVEDAGFDVSSPRWIAALSPDQMRRRAQRVRGGKPVSIIPLGSELPVMESPSLEIEADPDDLHPKLLLNMPFPNVYIDPWLVGFAMLFPDVRSPSWVPRQICELDFKNTEIRCIGEDKRVLIFFPKKGRAVKYAMDGYLLFKTKRVRLWPRAWMQWNKCLDSVLREYVGSPPTPVSEWEVRRIASAKAPKRNYHYVEIQPETNSDDEVGFDCLICHLPQLTICV